MNYLNLFTQLMQPILTYFLSALIHEWLELANQNDRSCIPLCWYSFCQIYMVLDDKIRTMYLNSLDKIDIILATLLIRFSYNWTQAQRGKLKIDEIEKKFFLIKIDDKTIVLK